MYTYGFCPQWPISITNVWIYSDCNVFNRYFMEILFPLYFNHFCMCCINDLFVITKLTNIVLKLTLNQFFNANDRKPRHLLEFENVGKTT